MLDGLKNSRSCGRRVNGQDSEPSGQDGCCSRSRQNIHKSVKDDIRKVMSFWKRLISVRETSSKTKSSFGLIISNSSRTSLTLEEKREVEMPRKCAHCLQKGRKQQGPRPDGISNITLKHAIHAHSEVSVDLYNACLEEETFPTNWKKLRLVFLPKRKKPLQDCSSYRSLCMLETPGKILERIICVKMDYFIEGKGGLAEHQNGFRKNRSTLDAVSLVINTA
ncbi:hypothetical protein TSAR_008228 [Trichomalopsis sarcophagae]|uniref:Reverse transcriptase domain-containing protein n=1 Tax=Trichomalopsis sarcophagae TaxID=543379 RepID=A0A232FMW8_9HYME|nr:hypothetical protein TSAR_008228 [Trichomalopsis sarcophagae]